MIHTNHAKQILAHFFSLHAEIVEAKSLWIDHVCHFHWLPPPDTTRGHADGHCLSSTSKVVYGLACRNRPWTVQIYSFLLHVWLMFHQPQFNTCFPVYNTDAQTISHPATWKSLRASPSWMCQAWVKSEIVFCSVLSQYKLKKLLLCAHTHHIDYAFLLYVPLILQDVLYCH